MENSRIFNNSLSDIVKKRTSVRTYDPAPLENDLRKKLEDYLEKLNGPFGSDVRYKLIDSKIAGDQDIKLGTYGFIKGVTSFVAAAVKNEGMSLEQLGYELEQFVLYATSLGLGTCWLGGTFNKREFAKVMDLKEDEILPIVIPVGYPKEKERLLGSLMKAVVGSGNRKNFEDIFYNENFDNKLTASQAGDYKDALEMLRLAPSASNKQPWRIVKENHKLHIYICHTKGYSKNLKFDMQRIDMGIAMCHIDLALKEAGYSGGFKKLKQSIRVLNEDTEYVISWCNDN